MNTKALLKFSTDQELKAMAIDARADFERGSKIAHEFIFEVAQVLFSRGDKETIDAVNEARAFLKGDE